MGMPEGGICERADWLPRVVRSNTKKKCWSHECAARGRSRGAGEDGEIRFENVSNTNVTKHRNCLACPSGFYQAKEQESKCEICPAGWSSQNDEGSKACEVRLEWRMAQGGPCVPAQAYKVAATTGDFADSLVKAEGCPEPASADNESVTMERIAPYEVRLQWDYSANAQWAETWEKREDYDKEDKNKQRKPNAKLTGWEIELS